MSDDIYTPGPWGIDNYPIGEQETRNYAVFGPHGVPVAELFTGPASWSNAHLISAAPDLVEIARAVVELMERLYPTAAESVDMSGLESALLFGARAALRKAGVEP